MKKYVAAINDKTTYEEHVWRSDEIFVFGSNLAGIHGAGAAKFALENCGAVWGRGVGLQNKSYALPTKGETLHTLSLLNIGKFVNDFIKFSNQCSIEIKFFLTAVGTGLAGFTDDQIAPLFIEVPQNVRVPPQWRPIIAKARERI